MMGDPRSHGLWELTAPSAPPTPPLAGEIECDVAVVGAGFTGLSAALHAAKAGASVVVLDGAEIGFGGSGRNVGLVNAGIWVEPDELPRVLGDELRHRAAEAARRRAARRLRAGRQARDRLRGRAQRHAALRGRRARASPSSQERERQWRARGAPVRLLDAAEAAAKIGTNAYAGALLDARAGTIQPLAYARGLARAAIARRRARLALEPGRRLRRRRRPLDRAHAARRSAGEMGRRRHQRLHRRAMGGATGRADPSALFQFRHRPARRSGAARHPARAPGLLGHAARC